MRAFLTCLVVCVLLLPVSSATAQWWEVEDVVESLDNCIDAADGYMARGVYGYAPQISMVSAFLVEGDYYPMVKNLEPRRNYVVIAAGDSYATDVNLRIWDESGRLIASDTSSNRLAVVEFNAQRGGQLMIETELYLADEELPIANVSCVILQEGGYYVPRSEFDIACQRLTDFGESAFADAERQGRELDFNMEYGQALLFGGLLGSEDGTMLTNLSFGTGTMLAVAVGDSDAEDLDLTLFGDDDRQLTADWLPNATPVIRYETDEDQLYKLRVTSEAARDSIPTYCLVGLMQIRQPEP